MVARVVTLAFALALAPACSTAPGDTSGSDGGGADSDLALDSVVDLAIAAPDLTGPADALGANRDRLLASYLAFLQAHAGTPQTNGLDGATLATTCALWTALDPSSRAAFLTLTARLQGSTLASDGSSALSHVTRLYRIAGGKGATAGDHGSCGDGEYNRLMLSMDGALHAALVAANGGATTLSDIPAGTSWRASRDLAGPHAPFTLSDETDRGAPRGQVQFFRDPTTAPATAPLGRVDLTTLVDPFALEIDQDYDCAHNSNALCSYTTYGALCFPQPTMLGSDLYVAGYGSFDPAYQPACL